MGKSSLISTFVSRYFDPDPSNAVPGVMTRVQLPPTHIWTHALYDASCQQRQRKQPSRGSQSSMYHNPPTTTKTTRTTVTTVIVDSQRADVALQQGTTEPNNSPADVSEQPSEIVLPPKQVDSILLVHDLSRPETLVRLEHHWLPLLERTYQGKVNSLSSVYRVSFPLANRLSIIRPCASRSQ